MRASIVQAAGGGFALAPAARERLAGRLTAAVRRSGRRSAAGPTLAALTVELPAGADPSATVAASRRPDDPWFCMEHPDRDRSALAGLGCAVALDAQGPERFAAVAARWRALAAGALADAPEVPGSGPVAVGGFAFADQGGASPAWSAYPAASLHVPELALARRGDQALLTLTTLAGAGDAPDALLARLERRLAELRTGPLPLLDPDPAVRARVVSTMPPEHFEEAVARAVERIRRGDFAKVVLAREVQVHAAAGHDAAALLGVLREAFPSCFTFCVGRGAGAFVAASPELLVRREGLRAATLALAGSTRRSADPAVDDHLGEQLLRSPKDRSEQAIVAERIQRTLRPHAVWVAAAEDPVLVKVLNIQHLATPIRAQLARPVAALELAGLLHPTPAVGGEPLEAAAPVIPALEGLDRGWYAGPVGWTDANEDGEFCVALRCALLDGPVARLYAGVGVVADSDPAAELAETEIKLQALLPALAP